ncbi:MAG: PIN domain-containing protein [Deltaproteobacteria bacterium]|nr:PIN domain-containing protein [Deltaproteobacteria bacterium]
MTEKIFIDTNVLFYAYDENGSEKHLLAKNKLEEIWQNSSGVISLQVLQEFYNSASKKLINKLQHHKLKEIIGLYKAWELVKLDISGLLQAIDLQQDYKISFWDSLIVQAALSAHCVILLTEDLNHGQKIKGMKIVNPFKS